MQLRRAMKVGSTMKYILLPQGEQHLLCLESACSAADAYCSHDRFHLSKANRGDRSIDEKDFGTIQKDRVKEMQHRAAEVKKVQSSKKVKRRKKVLLEDLEGPISTLAGISDALVSLLEHYETERLTLEGRLLLLLLLAEHHAGTIIIRKQLVFDKRSDQYLQKLLRGVKR
jgi:hypothetical protein